jgi:3-oxoacyl-[acyl-carrier protein] reductase
MQIGLKDKAVVITGGASGIGAAMALEYAKEGAKVTVCGRIQAKLDDFIEKAAREDSTIESAVCDVTDEAALRQFAANVFQRHGHLDVWINNAGITIKSPLLKLSASDWNRVLQTNLTAVFNGSKFAAGYLKRNGGGSIVNIASFTGLIASAGNGAYSVAKAGVIALTKVFAAELAPDNIRVNAIIPGYIHTEMGDIDIKTKAEQIIKPISMRRFGQPPEIAAGAVFLSSEAASYITGEALVISGGKFVVQNAVEPWRWET